MRIKIFLYYLFPLDIVTVTSALMPKVMTFSWPRNWNEYFGVYIVTNYLYKIIELNELQFSN